jgi:DNA-binding MarR family transcriptional regulator
MPENSDVQTSPAYYLWLATNAWQRHIRKALQPLDLTFVQFTVLAAIKKLDLPAVCQADICRFATIDPNMASSVVRSLELKGLIQRKPHPTDRRAHSLELTTDGAALMAKARTLLRPVGEDFFAPLGEEREELARMLKVIALHEAETRDLG